MAKTCWASPKLAQVRLRVRSAHDAKGAGTKGRAEKQTVRGLIVVPTRELANQVADTVRKLAEFTNISCFTVVGGAKADPQIRALKKGLDILVATLVDWKTI